MYRSLYALCGMSELFIKKVLPSILLKYIGKNPAMPLQQIVMHVLQCE